MINIGMVSLGCDKNRVDSEYALGQLGIRHRIVQDPDMADLIIVNTCGFIESAKREAIETIFEMATYKEHNLKYLVVMGCLAQRYYDEVSAIPEVDLTIRLRDNERIAELIDELIGEENIPVKDSGRVVTTPYHYAYLKIADGCNNHCTYCAIPSIRGKYVSYSEDKLVDEAKALYNDYGTKELIIVAQDTTRYGTDRGYQGLLPLLDRLSATEVEKIRLMYCYPECVDRELVTYVSSNQKMCNYLDIPLQHIDDRVLKSMGRRNTEASTRAMLDMIREIDPTIAIRSSFIVGFPTETEEAFEKLCEFVQGAELTAGFFKFSMEEGTPATRLKDLRVSIKNSRYRRISAIQSEVMIRISERYVGTIQRVLYEGINYDTQSFVGRTEYSAPDIDPKVYFKSDFPLDIGHFYDVNVTGTKGFDLVGGVLK